MHTRQLWITSKSSIDAGITLFATACGENEEYGVSLGAEIERKNIVSRLNSGRQLAIEKGVRLGRPVGSGMTDEELLQKYPDDVKRLKKGLSVRDTAAACNVSTFTVQKVKKIFSGR